MTKAQHDLIEAEITPFVVGTRTKSAALLAWFLERVWGLDPSEVEAAICDGGGDKGIDGLIVDHDTCEITVFQAQHCIKHSGTAGDAKLKQFVGALTPFASSKGIASLLGASPNKELHSLLVRNDIGNLIDSGEEYAVKGVYVTNCSPDRSATDYVDGEAGKQVVIWGQGDLYAAAVRIKRPDLLDVKVTFDVNDFLHEDLREGVKMYLAAIPATQLVSLPGIADSSIFDQNVRLSLGNTKINKELVSTIGDHEEHSIFPAFHNGLTILTHDVDVKSENQLVLSGLSVVNGCQSLLSFFRERDQLTDDLKVLVRMIEIQEHSDLIDVVTYRTNNQNPVNVRDLRSNSVGQRGIQNEVAELYSDKLFYSIKRGESGPANIDVIDNGLAAQLIMSVYLKDPVNAVRKNLLFTDDVYYRIFSKNIDAHKVYLLHLLNKLIVQHKNDLPLSLQSSFASVRFTITYLVAEMVRSGGRGATLLDSPDLWLPEKEGEIVAFLNQIVSQAVDVVNLYVTQKTSNEERYKDTFDSNFDPKTIFKSGAGLMEVDKEAKQSVKYYSMMSEKRGDDYFFNVEPVR